MGTEDSINENHKQSSLVLKSYSDIEERSVEWLWEPYIPLGAVTTVEGNMGEGKSWFTLALAAAVSTGHFPFTKEHYPPATVLHINVEDAPDQTIRPRLRIVGADCKRMFIIQGTAKTMTSGDRVLDFTLDHIPELRNAILEKAAKLVILDPLQAYLPGRVNMNRTEDMRRLFNSLNQLSWFAHFE